LAAGGSAAWLATGMTRAPGAGTAPEGDKAGPASDPTTKLRRVGSDDVIVPPAVQTALGIKTAPAVVSTRKRRLPTFQGRLNYDNTTLARVQTAFPGRVEELGTTSERITSAIPSATTVTSTRSIKHGDEVKKGAVLAVIWSKDLGEKKSEYVDALSKLKTDERTLTNLRDLYLMNATAERSVREQERTVQADRIAADRAETTLKSWRIDPKEIADLQAEAIWLSLPEIPFFPALTHTRTDPATWARVEIKAPLTGVILEQNVTFVGQVVDPTIDLFRIGDMSTLAVWVHLFENDLPLVQNIPLPTPWVITLPSRPGAVYNGKMELIAPSIDPTQQTALVTGTVENKTGELRSGMFATVTLELPAANGEIEVPAEAVVEDGKESIVYVRSNAAEDRFTRTKVRVIRRSRDVIAIAAEPDGVKPGDLVITAGSLLLNDAVEDLPVPKP
jgi:membrane fusion protein, heavy metal efflux system